jgi:hypothetical protein
MAVVVDGLLQLVLGLTGSAALEIGLGVGFVEREDLSKSAMASSRFSDARSVRPR